MDQHCSAIKNAVLKTIQEHKLKTPDIGGTSSTTQFMESVLNEIINITPATGFNYQMQQSNQASRFKNID